jgi:hypothetical protein
MIKSDRAATRWLRLGLLIAPSLPLLAMLALEVQFGGTQHFFLHTLTGWDIGLIALLAASYFGIPWRALDGFVPFVFALWAQLPDIIYISGIYHRDWMDIFLFHIGLDEIIAISLPALALLWAVLMLSYVYFRLDGASQMPTG